MKAIKDFKAKYPDIYRVIFEEGKKAGLADGIKQGEAAVIIKEKAGATAQQAKATAQQAAFDKLPIEDKAKITWDANASLRAEFRLFDTYLAYVRGVADGRIKI
jgi:uncharacterized membrane protein (UPF0182 family)